MKLFVAYPNNPSAIGQCIRAAADKLRTSKQWDVTPWEELDNWGRPLTAPIFSGISSCDCVVVDITRLNFNVTFEMGYAIGAKRRLLPVINRGLTNDEEKFASIGIYDSLGFKKYENSDQLFELLVKESSAEPINFTNFRDTNAPIFLLETPTRSDEMGRIIARVKKSRLRYRSFVRAEDARLPSVYAIDQVARSYAVIVPLCTSEQANSFEHNLKAAFVAGLAYGMGVKTMILQERGGPAPADIRDEVATYCDINEIDEHINGICYYTHELLHSRQPQRVAPSDVLSMLSVGDPTAENEFATLGSYYVRTDEFYRARRGEVGLITGRKGTGKTALFAQIRDDVRRNIQNIVVDLKPEGYQLVKLKEEVLRTLEQGSKDHLITAFWEYIIYMEIAAKLLEKDHGSHYQDKESFERYERLRAIYEADKDLAVKGDFSERLNSLATAMAKRYSQIFPDNTKTLTQSQVTEILHCHEIGKLRKLLEDYLSEKNEVWLLFDNLDKGWTPGGVSSSDVLILRCLLDATRKIRNDLCRSVDTFRGIVFVRNDVYQILLNESPDFGKDTRANLDWRDRELLRKVLLNRLSEGLHRDDLGPEDVFSYVCVPHVGIRETIDLMIDMSLMRPRNLIKAFNYARGVAVNRNHQRIEEDDVRGGLKILSDDIFNDCGNELRDVLSEANDFLYRFIGEGPEFSKDTVQLMAIDHGIAEDNLEKLVEYLLYYGVFGLRVNEANPTYIFDLSYDMRRMLMLREKFPKCRYVLHPILYPALGIAA